MKCKPAREDLGEELFDGGTRVVELERLELENELSDYKAWPVLSLSFVYNF